MPNARGEIALTLKNHSVVKSERFDRTQHPFVREVVRADYQRMTAEIGVRGRPADFNVQLLAQYRREYGFAPNEIAAPSGGADIGPDDFTRADGDTIGNQLTWTEVEGDTDTVSNRAQHQTHPATNRAEHDLSSANHSSLIGSVTHPTSNGIQFAFARLASSGATPDYYGSGYDANANRWRMYKRVSGSSTQLGDNSTGGRLVSVGQEADGSTITAYRGGVQHEQQTDTAITGNTRTGFGGAAAGTPTQWEADDFEASAIAGAAGVRLYHSFARGTNRALARGIA